MKVTGPRLIREIIDESPELINGLIYKEVLENLFPRLEKQGFSRNYIGLLIHKLTVNYPTRTTLGEAGDFFYTKDEQYFLYNGNEDIEAFHFDKELGALVTFGDPALAGKPCAIEDGCDFFEDVVVQGITER